MAQISIRECLIGIIISVIGVIRVISGSDGGMATGHFFLFDGKVRMSKEKSPMSDGKE